MSEHPREDLPGLLLGELTPEKVDILTQHLQTCPTCQRDLVTVATANAALREGARLPAAEDLPPRRPAGQPGRRSGWTTSRRWTTGFVAAVAAAGLVLGMVGFWRASQAGPPIPLVTADGSAPAGEARVAGTDSRQLLTLAARDLPDPEGGFYQVWLVAPEAGELAIGVLAPDGQGVWSVPAEATSTFEGGDLIISLEPADGGTGRDGEPVARGEFRAG